MQSALAQTYEHIEVVVVDDGSTDDTRERLEPYMHRICYIYQTNQGLSAARNTGIRAAHGEWIALLDSDDVWTDDKTERQVEAVLHHGWDVVVCTGKGPSSCERNEHKAFHFEDLFFVSPAFGSSALIRRACFDITGLFDDTLTSVEDRDMMLRLGRHFRIGSIRGRYVILRAHEGNMSRNASRMKSNYEKVVQKAFGWPEMQGRPFFRTAVRSYVHLDSALEYAHSSIPCAARELAKSVLLWPFPLGRGNWGRLRRLKLAARLFLEATRIWPLLFRPKWEESDDRSA